MRTQSDNKQAAGSVGKRAGKREWPSRNRFQFCTWLVERIWRIFWNSHRASLRKPKQSLTTFDIQLKIALREITENNLWFNVLLSFSKIIGQVEKDFQIHDWFFPYIDITDNDKKSIFLTNMFYKIICFFLSLPWQIKPDTFTKLTKFS